MDTHIKSLRQNLIDTGCNDATIERFVNCASKKEQLMLLAEHRRKLLQDYHKDARKLDCLDYLANQLKKEKQK